jgi:hypothetical protein
MPKKFSIVDKRKWLEKYEGGKAEATIASESKCDVRTVKKGLEEARRERDAQLARSELLKQALLGHQEKLKSALEGMLLTLTMPAEDWAVFSWNRDGESIFNKSDHDTEKSRLEAGKASKELGTEVNLVHDMLREHLRNDNLWKILPRRERVFSIHRSERIMLQRKVVSILKEETGYELVDSNVPGPFLYSYIAGHLFFSMALRWAFGNKSTDWQDKVIADKVSATVKYFDSILAEARGAEEECRKKLLKAFDKMKILPEATRIVDSYKELEEETLRARRVIEEILILGLIPGQCRVCRRLGI